MQKPPRLNEAQFVTLMTASRLESTISGWLSKKDGNKWIQKWFVLYRNLLFQFDSEIANRATQVYIIEACYCEQLAPQLSKGDKQFAFALLFHKDGTKFLHLRADTEQDCVTWVKILQLASFGTMVEEKAQLEQKHLHLAQVLQSERQSKWHYVQQTEELSKEVKKLKEELRNYNVDHATAPQKDGEIEKIKKNGPVKQDKILKVQSFFRGWICRRRWKQIVEEYIRSPHAESMRKRNGVVFNMVEQEEDYVHNMTTLVSCFLRPLQMAASSKKPLITHDDVSSIFLNSETILFLHQIFLKGWAARMENWPTLVIGDLFDMLLPMLGIYQEYVRNHHYSLQVLAEYKQKPEFVQLLKRYEEKPACDGKVLETYLTYPMYQIPKYILSLHDLLSHTPHDHVERKKLEFAKSTLEKLSATMHDQVSETENIRKNLAIERMIIEGCDILLDANQTFVRQGTLLQIVQEKSRSSRPRLGSFGSISVRDKGTSRKVFLFTNHLLLTSRASNGRLHLAKHFGKVPLSDCMLVEDPNFEPSLIDDENYDTVSNNSSSSGKSMLSVQDALPSGQWYDGLDFRIIVESKGKPAFTLTLVASSLQEKSAWCSDISQCIENLNYAYLLSNSMSSTSVLVPQAMRSDPRLFRDDKDIKYCKTLNSCKVPQIRHASCEKLLERLTDLRFLSIDFLNTFLLTYRVFTTAGVVIDALRKVVSEVLAKKRDDVKDVYETASPGPDSKSDDSDVFQLIGLDASGAIKLPCIQCVGSENRSKSSDSSMSDSPEGNSIGSLFEDTDDSSSSAFHSPRDSGSFGSTMLDTCQKPPNINIDFCYETDLTSRSFDADDEKFQDEWVENSGMQNLSASIQNYGSSSETLVGSSVPTSPAARTDHLSSATPRLFQSRSANSSPMFFNNNVSQKLPPPCESPTADQQTLSENSLLSYSTPNMASLTNNKPPKLTKDCLSLTTNTNASTTAPRSEYRMKSPVKLTARLMSACGMKEHRANPSIRINRSPKLGSVVTSSRKSNRRSSSPAAATAFAAATAGASPAITMIAESNGSSVEEKDKASSAKKQKKKTYLISAAIMRILNVFKHWVSKYPQDFEKDSQLLESLKGCVDDITACGAHFTMENKVAVNILKILDKEQEERGERTDLSIYIIAQPELDIESFDVIHALDIAEQMTFLDHKIFTNIDSCELLSQAWMKESKNILAPNVTFASRRFNEVSQLVVSEVVSREDINSRVACIEKWTAIADVCKCMSNFNGVLQICAAFLNSSVYRLRKTWDKVSKQTKQTITKLQTLVSSDGRFKNMRDALHSCDSPCIPYLGLYLSDLNYIEEGSQNFVENGLVNFSKMRMIAHVIREVIQYQQLKYKIMHNPKAAAYLQNADKLLTDDQTYQASLRKFRNMLFNFVHEEVKIVVYPYCIVVEKTISH